MGSWSGESLTVEVTSENKNLVVQLLGSMGFTLDDYQVEEVGDIYDEGCENETVYAGTSFGMHNGLNLIDIINNVFPKTYVRYVYETGNNTSDGYLRHELTYVPTDEKKGKLFLGVVDYCYGEGTVFEEDCPYIDDETMDSLRMESDGDLEESGTYMKENSYIISSMKSLEEDDLFTSTMEKIEKNSQYAELCVYAKNIGVIKK